MVKRPIRRGPAGWECVIEKHVVEAEFEHGIQKGKVKFLIEGREYTKDLIDKKLIFDENKPGKFELQC
jgi:hypothetical protein